MAVPVHFEMEVSGGGGGKAADLQRVGMISNVEEFSIYLVNLR